MADRETVIKELARCINQRKECEKCFYHNETFCTDVLMYNALELLKEQEAIVRCKDCTQNNQCSIQFKFADADNPGEWFCAYGIRR